MKRFIVQGKPSTPEEVRINYYDHAPSRPAQGSILLIHGYPETSHQFRHVTPDLVKAGYRVIVPDYRGAGQSSHPRDGYDKDTIASDLYKLVTEHLGITTKIHVVGHDIGGMIAHAYASRYAASTASVAWGECPLPGTKTYDRVVVSEAYGGLWHFVFHWQIDLPELLTAGREREYILSFYDRLAFDSSAFSASDIDYYAQMFSKPGAMRAGFDLYRAFHQDAENNKEWLSSHGKCTVPCLTLNGSESFLAGIAKEQSEEMYEVVKEARVSVSGHWCAEENPKDFVKHILEWATQHSD